MLQFLHQVADAFVGRFRYDDFDFHVLIAARARARIRHAFFAQAQRAAGAGRGRNANYGAAVDRGDLDLRAQRRFADRHGQLDVDIAASPLENGVRMHNDAEIQVARGRAQGAGVPLAGNANARAIIHAGRNADVDGFIASNTSFAAASFASGADFAGAAATSTGDIETHFAGGLLNRAGAVAHRAGVGSADGASAAAGFASVHARNLHFLDGAAHGVPKIDFDLIFEVAPGFHFRLGRSAAAADIEELAEEIAEAGAPARASSAAKIEAFEIEIDSRFARTRSGAGARSAGREIIGVKAVLVIHLALLGVGKNVVGFLKLLEFLLGGFVAGIQVGMVLAREFAESGANVLGSGLARDAKEVVVVLFSRGSHEGSSKGKVKSRKRAGERLRSRSRRQALNQPLRPLRHPRPAESIAAPERAGAARHSEPLALEGFPSIGPLGFVNVHVFGVDDVAGLLAALALLGARCSGSRACARRLLLGARGLIRLIEHFGEFMQGALDRFRRGAQAGRATFVHGLLGIFDGLLGRFHVGFRQLVAILADHLLGLIDDTVEAVA